MHPVTPYWWAWELKERGGRHCLADLLRKGRPQASPSEKLSVWGEGGGYVLVERLQVQQCNRRKMCLVISRRCHRVKGVYLFTIRGIQDPKAETCGGSTIRQRVD